MIDIYTDGSCLNNGAMDSIGAWAFTSSDGAERYGVETNTTNNRMELQAIIEAMRYADGLGEEVTIHSDSNICVHCGNKEWKRKANLDLWGVFDSIKTKNHTLKWVKGHNGTYGNERADALCEKALNSC